MCRDRTVVFVCRLTTGSRNEGTGGEPASPDCSIGTANALCSCGCCGTLNTRCDPSHISGKVARRAAKHRRADQSATLVIVGLSHLSAVRLPKLNVQPATRAYSVSVAFSDAPSRPHRKALLCLRSPPVTVSSSTSRTGVRASPSCSLTAGRCHRRTGTPRCCSS